MQALTVEQVFDTVCECYEARHAVPRAAQRSRERRAKR
jgi:hypothetical protein